MPHPQIPFTLPFSDFIEDPIHDLNVVGDAVSRIVQQYQRPKIEALVGALAAPAQDLEDALIQIYTQRWLPVAVGVQLDVLGAIVGQPRLGFTDDFYRLCIQARIRINLSSGGPEELYGVLALVIPPGTTMTLHYFAPAAFEMLLGGVAISLQLGQLFASFITQARGAGIGGQTIWSGSAPSATFTLDGTSAQSLDAGGLAEAA
jgi:hypothetical protein